MILEKKKIYNWLSISLFFFQSITIHSFSLLSFFLLTRDCVWLLRLKNDLISLQWYFTWFSLWDFFGWWGWNVLGIIYTATGDWNHKLSNNLLIFNNIYIIHESASQYDQSLSASRSDHKRLRQILLKAAVHWMVCEADYWWS